MSAPIFYFEEIHGTFYLMDRGVIREFSSESEMGLFIADAVPDGSALLIEVTPDNWSELYDSGAFF
ncbi:hypothetical protein CFI10_09370 [Marinobacterium iners]|uniref:hypothetical protein n=1 Tax=Marinobacterium iners TaxID=48076 RepID=UPI001A8EC32B|nr:hypothetical protein [Marinobacterium iners]QSR35203.1 hypothetical protein CFI10_09370 [Marinobacterium iners]